jgi:hypothetical protein
MAERNRTLANERGLQGRPEPVPADQTKPPPPMSKPARKGQPKEREGNDPSRDSAKKTS